MGRRGDAAFPVLLADVFPATRCARSRSQDPVPISAVLVGLFGGCCLRPTGGAMSFGYLSTGRRADSIDSYGQRTRERSRRCWMIVRSGWPSCDRLHTEFGNWPRSGNDGSRRAGSGIRVLCLHGLTLVDRLLGLIGVFAGILGTLLRPDWWTVSPMGRVTATADDRFDTPTQALFLLVRQTTLCLLGVCGLGHVSHPFLPASGSRWEQRCLWRRGCGQAFILNLLGKVWVRWWCVG